MSKSVNEQIIADLIPRAEVPGWRETYGVVAGITRKPHDLGLGTQEPVDGVMTRWRDFRRAEPGFTQYLLGHQVHGSRVELHGQAGRARRSARRSGGRRAADLVNLEMTGEWRLFDGVDGHVAAATGTMLCVTVADCVPIYLVHPATKTVALLHAGWRGTAAGILQRGVQTLLVAAQGIPAEGAAESVVCHLGVSICGECYEVGPEVFDALGEFAAVQRPKGKEEKGDLDLRAVLARQAKALGIGKLTVSGHCAKHGEGWYSHRGGDGGRMVAYVGVPS